MPLEEPRSHRTPGVLTDKTKETLPFRPRGLRNPAVSFPRPKQSRSETRSTGALQRPAAAHPALPRPAHGRCSRCVGAAPRAGCEVIARGRKERAVAEPLFRRGAWRAERAGRSGPRAGGRSGHGEQDGGRAAGQDGRRGGLGGGAARGLRARAPLAVPARVPAAQCGRAARGRQRPTAAPRLPVHGVGQPRLPGLPVPASGHGEGAGNGRRHPSDRRARPHHERRTGCQEGVEEPAKKRAVEKCKESKDTGQDVKTTKAEVPMETESPLPKKQDKDTSKDSESSLSTCSSNQEALTASIAKAEEKPTTNAEHTVEQSPAPSSSEKEAGEIPSKEGKCENVPSPEKATLSSGSPTAAPQAVAVPSAASTSALQAPAVPPAATNSTPQAAVPPAATTSAPQAAEVPTAAANSAPLVAEVAPAATNNASQAATVPVTPTKSTPQAASVPPAAAKSTLQAASVPVTATKSTAQTSAALLSSKTQVSGLPSVSKSGSQAGPSLLLAAKGSSQAGTSLLLAPKSSTQVGASLLLASKGTAKAGSSLLASKSSAEVAASLLAARSGTQQGASLLTSKSSAQAAASLLAARSGAQQGPSRIGAQAAKSTQLASKSGLQASEGPAKALCKPLTSEDAKERQPFFNRLYKAVAWKLVAVGGFSPNVNHAELLNSSIQSVKATLDVAFVPLKELADLPQNKSSLENIVCELRCKSVYLGTGCGKNMENAKAVASREALKLFLKKKVIVKICKRKYKGSEIEDLVLLDEESKPSNLPPALLNPREII